MKRRTLLLLILLTGVFTSLFAQEKTSSNMLRMSPAKFANSTFQLDYEHVFNEQKHGIVISPGFILAENYEDSLIGLNATIQYRFYVNRWKDFSKTENWFTSFAFYAAPFAQGIWVTQKFSQSYSDMTRNYEVPLQNKITSYSGGLVFGAQLFMTKRIVFDAFLGGGIRYGDRVFSADASALPTGHTFVASDSYQEAEFGRAYTGVLPKAGFQMGFSF